MAYPWWLSTPTVLIVLHMRVAPRSGSRKWPISQFISSQFFLGSQQAPHNKYVWEWTPYFFLPNLSKANASSALPLSVNIITVHPTAQTRKPGNSSNPASPSAHKLLIITLISLKWTHFSLSIFLLPHFISHLYLWPVLWAITSFNLIHSHCFWFSKSLLKIQKTSHLPSLPFVSVQFIDINSFIPCSAITTIHLWNSFYLAILEFCNY